MFLNQSSVNLPDFLLYSEKIRELIQFRPNDPYFFWQVPTADFRIGDVERIQGYRYPSPGSRYGARVPIRESEDDVYNTNQYSRDPRNLPKDVRYRKT
jgi:hypothetical protein